MHLAATVDTAGALSWIGTVILPLLIGAVGVGLLAGAHKGNIRKAATTSGLALWGIGFVLGAVVLSQFNIIGLFIH